MNNLSQEENERNDGNQTPINITSNKESLTADIKKEPKSSKKSSGKRTKNSKGIIKGILEKKVLLIIVGIAVVLAIIASIAIPISNSTITKENTITASQLEDAIAISNLSTAEFVYNGIASKYRDDQEDPEYSISYDATCKAGVSMSDISFDIDDSLRIVYPHFPTPVVTSVSVDINSLSYLPRDPDIDMREVLEFCEDDVREGAENSEEFKRLATDNLKSVLEALTLPILQKAGYTIEWID